MKVQNSVINWIEICCCDSKCSIFHELNSCFYSSKTFKQTNQFVLSHYLLVEIVLTPLLHSLYSSDSGNGILSVLVTREPGLMSPMSQVGAAVQYHHLCSTQAWYNARTELMFSVEVDNSLQAKVKQLYECHWNTLASKIIILFIF